MSSTIEYSGRLDLNADLTKEKALAYLSKWFATYFVVEENNEQLDNPHLHLFGRSEKTITQLRNAVNRAGWKGNKCYSLKTCDVDTERYVRYMCKGPDASTGPTIIARQGFDYTDEFISQQHEAYWDENKALGLRKRKLEKAAAYSNLVAYVTDECKRRAIGGLEREKIAEIVVEYYAEHNKPLNVYYARGVVNTVSVKLDNGDRARQNLAWEIAQIK